MGSERDPGGPCGYCPPVSPEKQQEFLEMALRIDRMSLSASLKETLISQLVPNCPICKGTGFVRVCEECGGDGVLDKVEVVDNHEAFDPIGPDGSAEGENVVLLPVISQETGITVRMPHRRRTWQTVGWRDGEKCGVCEGGLVSIKKEEVGR